MLVASPADAGPRAAGASVTAAGRRGGHRVLRAVARHVVARRARQLARVGRPTLAVGMAVGLSAGLPGLGSVGTTVGVMFNRRSPRTGKRHLVTPYVSTEGAAGVGGRLYVNLRDPREHGVERLVPGFGSGNTLVGGRRAIASVVVANAWLGEQGAGGAISWPTPFLPHVYPGFAITTEMFVLSPRFARAVEAGTRRAKSVWQARVQPRVTRAWSGVRPVVEPVYRHTVGPVVAWTRGTLRPWRDARRARGVARGQHPIVRTWLPYARGAARAVGKVARVASWPGRTVRDAARGALQPYIDEIAPPQDGTDLLPGKDLAPTA